MNVPEFKAWIKGFSEAVDGAPTPDQWAKIRAEIDALSAVTTTTLPPQHLMPRQPFDRRFGVGPGELDFSITC